MNWIPLNERRPDYLDADKNGYVMTYRREDRQWAHPTRIGFSKWNRVTAMTHTHWAIMQHPGETTEPKQPLEQRVTCLENIVEVLLKQKEAK